MPWLRDWKSLLGPWLRTLVVLGLVFAVVAETPLRAVGGLPAWLTLGGTGTVAGSLPPAPGAPGQGASSPRPSARAPSMTRASMTRRPRNAPRAQGTRISATRRASATRRTGTRSSATSRTPTRQGHRRQKRTHPGGNKGQHPKDGKGKDRRRPEAQGHGPRRTRTRASTTTRTSLRTQRPRRARRKPAPKDTANADGTRMTAAVTAAATSLSFSPVADAQVSEANPVHQLWDLDPADGRRRSRPGYRQLPALLGERGERPGAECHAAAVGAGERRHAGRSISCRPLAPVGARPVSPGTIARGRRAGCSMTRGRSPAAPGSSTPSPVPSPAMARSASCCWPQSSDGVVFDSREGTNKPQLILTLGTTTSTPPRPQRSPQLGRRRRAPPRRRRRPRPRPRRHPPGGVPRCWRRGISPRAPPAGTRPRPSCWTGWLAPWPPWATTPTSPARPASSPTATTRPGGATRAAPARPRQPRVPDRGRHRLLRLLRGGGGRPEEGLLQLRPGGLAHRGAQLQLRPGRRLRRGLAAGDSGCGPIWPPTPPAAPWPTGTTPASASANYGNDTMTQALWQALYDNGAEIVLSGHDHNYQRWTPQTPTGTKDATRGIREFVVGTGGRSHYALGTAAGQCREGPTPTPSASCS